VPTKKTPKKPAAKNSARPTCTCCGQALPDVPSDLQKTAIKRWIDKLEAGCDDIDNVRTANPAVTRAMVDRAADEMAAEKVAPARVCCYCGKDAPGEEYIHAEPHRNGDQLPLCRTCVSEEFPTTEQIRAKLARDRAREAVADHIGEPNEMIPPARVCCYCGVPALDGDQYDWTPTDPLCRSCYFGAGGIISLGSPI
jgi:hypothetical protein